MEAVHSQPIQGASPDNILPMQFSTPSGGVSWLGVGMLVLTITALVYTIRSHHHAIKSSTSESTKLAALEKDVIELKKRTGILKIAA